MKRSSRSADGKLGSGPGSPGIPPTSGGEAHAGALPPSLMGRRGFLLQALLGGTALGAVVGLARPVPPARRSLPAGSGNAGRSGRGMPGSQEEEMIIEL
jgi:hypothetical protein